MTTLKKRVALSVRGSSAGVRVIPRKSAALRINARLSPTLAARVQRLANKGSTLTDIVQAALNLYCTTQEKQTSAFEIFSTANLLGSVAWGPTSSETTKAALTNSLSAKLAGKKL
jgi:hypothetical protein